MSVIQLCKFFRVKKAAMENSDSSSSLEASDPSLSQSRKRKRFQLDVEELEVDVNAPEPSSKKALRKARKSKIAKPPAQVIQKKQSQLRLEKPTAQNNFQDKHLGNGIWIGNLPWSVTKADVRIFITKNTEISDDMITRIHMPAPNDTTSSTSQQKIKPQNKGFAYVDFSTESALTQAIALSETLLSGRRVLIKDSKSFEGRPEKLKEEGIATTTQLGKPPSKRIFVGNLGFDTSKEDLQDHFGRCGNVIDVHVATFEDSGKCKGYAWVEFEEVKAGEAAVRGWIDYEEAKDTKDQSDDDESSEGIMTKRPTKKKPKPRKWWVNKLKGRPLRMEFAEDQKTRYKKRYGKDGTGRKGSGAAPDDDSATVDPPETRVSRISNNKVNRTDSRAATAQSSTRPWPKTNTKKVDARTVKPGAALAAAPRLTGGIVASLGKKTTFA